MPWLTLTHPHCNLRDIVFIPHVDSLSVWHITFIANYVQSATLIRDISTQFHRGKVVRIVWHRIGILLLSHYNLVTQFVCKNSYSSDESAINSLTYNSPYSHVLLPPLMVSSILGRKNDLFVLAQKLLGLFSSPDDLSADQLKNFLISLSLLSGFDSPSWKPPWPLCEPVRCPWTLSASRRKGR